MLRVVGLLVDGPELAVGGDQPLQVLEQLVHRVEFRTLLGQPQQDDSQASSQGLTAGGVVTGGLVQQQPQRPPGVALPQVAQEGLEVLLTLPGPAQDQPVARTWVDGPE